MALCQQQLCSRGSALRLLQIEAAWHRRSIKGSGVAKTNDAAAKRRLIRHELRHLKGSPLASKTPFLYGVLGPM